MKTTIKKENPILLVSSSENIMKAPEQHIRERAFEIFLDRNEDGGSEMTDWYQAENELNPSMVNV